MNNSETTWRFSFVGALMAVVPILIVLQLARIQVDTELVKRVLQDNLVFTWERRTIVPTRGQIYDAWGNLLAGNETVYEVGIELRYVRPGSEHTVALVLSEILDVEYAYALGLASIEGSENAIYAMVADHVTQEQIDKLEREIVYYQDIFEDNSAAPSLHGVIYRPHLERIYPEKDLASNVLGFVSREGTGYFGVEQYYNSLLSGTPKMVSVPLDPNRVKELPAVPDGANLVLTLDRRIQRAMEGVIDQAIKDSGAQSGTLVVIDPTSGEIKALASTPRLDLNQYWNYQKIYAEGIPFNRGVSQAYETGSVFKVITMASGLDSGAVKPETVFVDTGQIELGGIYIYNWNMGAWGPQNMQGCLQHSLNVCLAWVATEMGPNTFYSYLKAFGIGRLTGIDMAGESPGRLKAPGDGDWFAADLGTNAFGQGVSSTPVQMAAAISAVANGGVIMAPHIVRSVINEGYQHDIERHAVGAPISAETARTLTRILAKSLEIESSDALVTGYRVAGKTGTAEIPTPYGYTTSETNASFVGWGPVDDPRFLIYVWLEKPVSSPWGSIVAAPVFADAVEELVVLMGLPPDDIRRSLLGQ